MNPAQPEDIPTPHDGSTTGQIDAAEQRLNEHNLTSAKAIAAHFGITEASARRLMSDNGVAQLHGYPLDQALNVPRPGRNPLPGPGRGHKKPPAPPEDGDHADT